MQAEFSGAGKGEYEVCAGNGCKQGECNGCVQVLDANREVLERKNGKEKTDEGSSVLLYFVTEEGERE